MLHLRGAKRLPPPAPGAHEDLRGGTLRNDRRRWRRARSITSRSGGSAPCIRIFACGSEHTMENSMLAALQGSRDAQISFFALLLKPVGQPLADLVRTRMIEGAGEAWASAALRRSPGDAAPPDAGPARIRPPCPAIPARLFPRDCDLAVSTSATMAANTARRASTTAANSDSLSLKIRYSVFFDMPALRAMSSMLAAE